MVQVDGLGVIRSIQRLGLELERAEGAAHGPAHVGQVDGERVGRRVALVHLVGQVAEDVAHLRVDGARGFAAHEARQAAHRARRVAGHHDGIEPTAETGRHYSR